MLQTHGRETLAFWSYDQFWKYAKEHEVSKGKNKRKNSHSSFRLYTFCWQRVRCNEGAVHKTRFVRTITCWPFLPWQIKATKSSLILGHEPSHWVDELKIICWFHIWCAPMLGWFHCNTLRHTNSMKADMPWLVQTCPNSVIWLVWNTYHSIR